MSSSDSSEGSDRFGKLESDSSRTLDFGSEQGYHSDGRVSESGSDFSAKVSDFEAGGSENGLHSETATTVSSQTVSGLEMPLMNSGVAGDFVRSETQSQLSAVSSSLISDTSEGLHPGDEDDLIQAVKTGDTLVVRQLALKDGSDLSATDSNHRTALHVACSFGRMECVQILLSAGSNVDACSVMGQTALHEACKGGHYAIVQQLLSEVSDLDAVDSNGMSAAHFCCMSGEVDCLALLCNQGCDICLEDSLGRSGVHLATLKDHANIIQCLMERGMELDTIDCNGKTPAHYASRYGSLASLKLLTANGVDINSGVSLNILYT